jgi:hypothetical protein
MQAANDSWTHVAVTVGVIASLAAVAAIARRGWLPRAPEPRPGEEPTCGERRRYHAAGIVGCALGAVAGLALWLVPPPTEPAAWFRHSYFAGEGRLLGPFFFALAGMCLAMPLLSKWWIRDGAMAHMIARTAASMGGADPRRIASGLGVVVALAALALHFTLRAEHTTFTDAGVRWRDWLSLEQHERPWTVVEEVRLVRLVEPMVGAAKERPHLVLRFRDGAMVRIGARVSRPPNWDEVAAQVAARSGAPVRRVERS